MSNKDEAAEPQQEAEVQAEAAENHEEPEAKSGKVRNRANKSPYSARKLAKRSRVKPPKVVDVANTPVDKVKQEMMRVFQRYIRPFLMRNFAWVVVISGVLVLALLSYVVSSTLEVKLPQTKQQQKMAQFTDRVNFTIAVGEGEDVQEGEIEIGLWGSVCPLTVQNFIALATHTMGYGYRGTDFFFFRPGTIIAGGDVVTNTGQHGKSAIINDKLAAENFDIPHFHGCIASPEIKDSETVSQFYLSFAKLSEMNGKSVVFGRITRGIDFFFDLNKIKVDDTFHPLKRIRIIETKHVKEEDVDLPNAPKAPEEALKEDAPKEDAPKEDTPEEEAPKEDPPKEDTPKEDTPKEDAPKEDAPKEDVPKEDAPEEDAPKEEAPKEE